MEMMKICRGTLRIKVKYIWIYLSSHKDQLNVSTVVEFSVLFSRSDPVDGSADGLLVKR